MWKVETVKKEYKNECKKELLDSVYSCNKELEIK